MTVKVETLVIGAGVIGSSVAMSLARLGHPAKGIRIADFDLEGSLSSSELNAGGVRATWSQPVNIRMAKLSIEYFASVAEEVGYRPCGYLWLHTADRFPGALKVRERQISEGWNVEVWDLSELRRRVPFIDKTDGIAGCTFGVRDGLVNPNLLKNHFRGEAKRAGVAFDDRILIRSAESTSHGIRILAEKFPLTLSAEAKQSAMSGSTQAMIGEKIEYIAGRVVNCAGPWASSIAKILGYVCPSYSVRRQVSIFDSRDVDLTPYGMIVDTSGVYFHPEATNGLAGFATPSEPKGMNFHYDGDAFFTEHIWPPLYERSTYFERLKHVTGWAGLYEVSPDESAIIGQVSDRIFEAHSFSGHGVMHSYCAGLAIAEKIVHGKYQTLDVSELSGSRFDVGKEVRESMLI